MSSKTKIVVLHMKEVIYTAVFLILGIAMIAILIMMFGSKKDTETSVGVSADATPPEYISGVYTSMIELNDNSFDVQVTVDSNHIKSIELINLSESTAAMYPLIEPALEDLSAQICETQSTENITYSEESKYTSLLLLDAIDAALEKAVPAS